MKKIITLFGIIASIGVINATTFFVNSVSGDDTKSGLSWTDAVKTIGKAQTLAVANAGVDDVFIKGGDITTSTVWTLTTVNENFYGSFEGIETSPSQRPMNDNDGNGIVEPWEFKYPTKYSTTYGTGTAINGVLAIFDGFTITHTATRNNGSMATLYSQVASTVKNCVFTGSRLTYTSMSISSNGGCLVKMVGAFKDCLVEKNDVSIGYGTTDIKIAGILDVPCPATGAAVEAPNIEISGCVFRNNKVNISNTAGTPVSYLRGQILNVTCNDPIAKVTFSDCIVNNNEVSYTGANGNVTAPKAGIASTLNYSSSATNTSFINCTFANNKTTNLGTCLHVEKSGTVVNKVYNTAFWNNQNTITSRGVTSGVSMNSSAYQNASSVFSNNYMDVATTGGWGTVCTYTNNKINLDQANTGTNAPYFSNPPLNGGANVIGVNRVAGSADSIAIAMSTYKLNLGSYLAGNGVATSVLTDKAGVAFSTPPSVGAYEYIKTTPVITWSQDLTGLKANQDPLTVSLTATSSADATYGAPITYTSGDENIVSVTGDVLTIVGVGSTTVTANQAANRFYNAATAVVNDVTVDNTTSVSGVEANVKCFKLIPSGIVSSISGVVQVLSFNGAVLQTLNVVEGQTISLTKGVYIVKIATASGVSSQKIVL